MFDIEQMKESIQIWLLGQCHELDFLAHKVFRTCNLLAWPWVLFQWLQILSQTHQFYADLEIPSLDVLTAHSQVVHQYLEQMVVTVSDPTLLQSEVGVGSDVAQAQSTEAVPQMAMANIMNEENLTDDHVSPSLGVSFVMNNALTHLHDNKALCETLLRPLEGLINLENVDDNYFRTAVANRSAGEETVHDSDIPDPNTNIHEFSQEDVHRIIFHRQVANGTGEEYGSCHQAQPLNEFEKNDEGLCSCFPSVFVFGRAYK